MKIKKVKYFIIALLCFRCCLLFSLRLGKVSLVKGRCLRSLRILTRWEAVGDFVRGIDGVGDNSLVLCCLSGGMFGGMLSDFTPCQVSVS